MPPMSAPFSRPERTRRRISVLVVEHDMPGLTAICDRMIALELGQVIAEGSPADMLEPRAVIE
jgi:ABC-type branched-subunit amino acid transport system ATPase component